MKLGIPTNDTLLNTPEEGYITMTRQEARDFIDLMPDGSHDLIAEAFDFAQGNSDPEARFVVIHVLPDED